MTDTDGTEAASAPGTERAYGAIPLYAPEMIPDLNDGRPVAWSDACAPGGYVCAMPDDLTDDGRCGNPVESEPCDRHEHDAPSPAVEGLQSPRPVVRVLPAGVANDPGADLDARLDARLASLSAPPERDRLNAALAEIASLREQARAARADRDRIADELAELREGMASWPRCPDNCGCRLATTDPEASECGCDGPCTMECKENGYPEAMSYRDLAVKHAMDEADSLRRRLAAYRAEMAEVRRIAYQGGQDAASVRRELLAYLEGRNG